MACACASWSKRLALILISAIVCLH
ncbi:rCG49343 [Rattus norvegicus]|uniref:RCG49343 n=1 Tax=Rattus norvegicus TaxID=10116 RepID=A6J2M1_RAT|nr:rCG49343 [Rattus norvegicus]